MPPVLIKSAVLGHDVWVVDDADQADGLRRMGVETTVYTRDEIAHIKGLEHDELHWLDDIKAKLDLWAEGAEIIGIGPKVPLAPDEETPEEKRQPTWDELREKRDRERRRRVAAVAHGGL